MVAQQASSWSQELPAPAAPVAPAAPPAPTAPAAPPTEPPVPLLPPVALPPALLPPVLLPPVLLPPPPVALPPVPLPEEPPVVAASPSGFPELSSSLEHPVAIAVAVTHTAQDQFEKRMVCLVGSESAPPSVVGRLLPAAAGAFKPPARCLLLVATVAFAPLRNTLALATTLARAALPTRALAAVVSALFVLAARNTMFSAAERRLLAAVHLGLSIRCGASARRAARACAATTRASVGRVACIR